MTSNLFEHQVEVMQQLLQSQSTSFRLIGLKRILAEAVEELSAVMMDDGVMPDDLLNQVKRASYSRDDDDDDLMPPPEYNGVTIESELDEELVADLNISEANFADFKRGNNERGIFNKTVNVMEEKKAQSARNSQAESMSSRPPEEEVDIWDAEGDAFQ
jgi:hypothetical protein